jgi:mRNA interferase MazF
MGCRPYPRFRIRRARLRRLGKSWDPLPMLIMIDFKRGDVVLVDLGMQAKVRPCVVVSIPKADRQRNMSVVVPMTTEIRHGECEVSFSKPPWLKQASVINLLGIAGIDNSKIERRLAMFPPERMEEVSRGLTRLLNLQPLTA